MVSYIAKTVGTYFFRINGRMNYFLDRSLRTNVCGDWKTFLIQYLVPYNLVILNNAVLKIGMWCLRSGGYNANSLYLNKTVAKEKGQFYSFCPRTASEAVALPTRSHSHRWGTFGYMTSPIIFTFPSAFQVNSDVLQRLWRSHLGQ